MKLILRTALLSLGMSVVSIFLMNVLHLYFFANLGNWTLHFFQKFLIIHFTMADNLLIGFFPLIVGIYGCLLEKSTSEKSASPMALFRLNLQVLLSLSLAIAAGTFIAVATWNQTDPNPLLPDYIKYQPFRIYWTLFIAMGILVPIAIHRLRKNDRLHNQIIDDNTMQ